LRGRFPVPARRGPAPARAISRSPPVPVLKLFGATAASAHNVRPPPRLPPLHNRSTCSPCSPFVTDQYV
jgi:hypothetical protein